MSAPLPPAGPPPGVPPPTPPHPTASTSAAAAADADDMPREARGTLSSVAVPSLLTGARYAAAGTAAGGGTWAVLAHWAARRGVDNATAVSRLALALSLPYLLALGAGAGVSAAVVAPLRR